MTDNRGLEFAAVDLGDDFIISQDRASSPSLLDKMIFFIFTRQAVFRLKVEEVEHTGNIMITSCFKRNW